MKNYSNHKNRYRLASSHFSSDFNIKTHAFREQIHSGISYRSELWHTWWTVTIAELRLRESQVSVLPRQRISCGWWSDDQVSRVLVLATLHAQETYQDRNEDMGLGRQLQWIFLQAGHTQGRKIKLNMDYKQALSINSPKISRTLGNICVLTILQVSRTTSLPIMFIELWHCQI